MYKPIAVPVKRYRKIFFPVIRNIAYFPGSFKTIFSLLEKLQNFILAGITVKNRWID